MPSRASYGHHSCYSEPIWNLLIGGGAAPRNLAGAKNPTSNAILCSQHEKQWRGCPSVPGAAQERSLMLRTDVQLRIWVCMCVRLAAAALTVASSASTRFDFWGFHLKGMGHSCDALWWVRYLLQSAFLLRVTFLCCSVESATMCCNGRRWKLGKAPKSVPQRMHIYMACACMFGKHAPLSSAVQHHRSFVAAS